ncbi:hypothetical protein TFLX_05498 [Thermoflexales bacterium]|nr:hypothetical protein TFLX_05498 [Thermoflexales bacterium]
MHHRLPHFRHARLVLVALVVLVLILIEIARLVTAQVTIDRAACGAARYAVTLLYDPANCPKSQPCERLYRLSRKELNALEDEMRLRTVYDVAQSYLRSNKIATTARVVVCSTRPGFTYDSLAERCLPRDDVGGQGDRVIVHIDYKYPLGSFLGLNLGTVPLQATYRMIVERQGPARITGLPPTILPRLTPTYPSYTRPWIY